MKLIYPPPPILSEILEAINKCNVCVWRGEGGGGEGVSTDISLISQDIIIYKESCGEAENRISH